VADGVNCSGGFLINSTCYVVFNHERVKWFTAVNRCLSLNASLAVFNDKVRNYVDKTLIPGEGNFKLSSWIGLVKAWWTWSGRPYVFIISQYPY